MVQIILLTKHKVPRLNPMFRCDISGISSKVEVGIVATCVKLLGPIHVNCVAGDLIPQRYAVVEVYFVVILIRLFSRPYSRSIGWYYQSNERTHTRVQETSLPEYKGLDQLASLSRIRLLVALKNLGVRLIPQEQVGRKILLDVGELAEFWRVQRIEHSDIAEIGS